MRKDSDSYLFFLKEKRRGDRKKETGRAWESKRAKERETEEHQTRAGTEVNRNRILNVWKSIVQCEEN